MRIDYLNSIGKIIDSNATIPSEHQKNLQILKDDLNLRSAIMESVERIVEKFINQIESQIQNVGRAYIHSGQAVQIICCDNNLTQNSFYHGLAGSALNRALADHRADFQIMASKGEDQKWFDYFYPTAR